MFDLMILLAAVLMFFVAFVSANIGLGGGLLYVPIMATFLFIPKNEIITYALLLAVFTAMMSAYNHFKKAFVSIRWGCLIGILTVPSAVISAFLGVKIAAEQVYFAFGILLVAISGKLLYDLKKRSKGAKEKAKKSREMPSVVVFVAIIAGVFAGVFGVGGGFLIAPALIYFLKFDTRKAMGTAAVAIIFLACASFGGYLYNSIALKNFIVSPIAAVVFSSFVMTGAFVGSKIGLKYLKTTTVYVLFIVVLLIAAFKMMSSMFAF